METRPPLPRPRPGPPPPPNCGTLEGWEDLGEWDSSSWTLYGADLGFG